MAKDEAVKGQAIGEDDKIRASGRHVGGLPDEPLVTINATSKPVGKAEKKDYQIVSDVQDVILGDNNPSDLDVENMEVGSGLLMAIEPNQTIDQVVLKANRQVHKLNEFYSVFELNDEGERILDMVMIEELKRNDDKSIQLNEKGNPIVGANQIYIPRRIQIRQYVCKAVTKGDKISDDGALIVRVF